MASLEQVEILKWGLHGRSPLEAWNEWRNEHPHVRPDLRNANLDGLRNVSSVNMPQLAQASNDRFRITIQGPYLIGVDLRRADMREAHVSGADLSGVDLRGADLTGANLTHTCLGRARLRGACCRGAILERADLAQADLRGVDLRGALLRGADLREACLSGVDELLHTIYGDYILAPLDKFALYRRFITLIYGKADLRGADLSGVHGLTLERLHQARVDRTTRLPEGL